VYVNLFLCILFNDTVSSAEFRVSNFRLINELERKRKEAVAK
jgi:hypothetical protein